MGLIQYKTNSLLYIQPSTPNTYQNISYPSTWLIPYSLHTRYTERTPSFPSRLTRCSSPQILKRSNFIHTANISKTLALMYWKYYGSAQIPHAAKVAACFSDRLFSLFLYFHLIDSRYLLCVNCTSPYESCRRQYSFKYLGAWLVTDPASIYFPALLSLEHFLFPPHATFINLRHTHSASLINIKPLSSSKVDNVKTLLRQGTSMQQVATELKV